MKHLLSILVPVFICLSITSCDQDEFLTRPPLDEMTDETYWTSEENVRSFSWGFYSAYFTGYGVGYAWGNYFSGQSLNDDFAPSSPTEFTQNVPTSGGGWTFSWVRKANLFIDRVQGVPMDQEAIDHWTGVGRFFRALEYNDLVKRFGDIQWYNRVLEEDDENLYKERDSRIMVMDSVLADFRYAAEHVRLSDGTPGLTVNKDVVLAFMSRVFLWHGTFLKYHDIDQTKAQEYLEAAKWAANEVIESGRYTLADEYKSVFNSMDLAGNSEVILYRKYEEGVLTHSLHSYSNKEPQTGASKDAIESYLCEDGLPIDQSPLYQGDLTIEDVMSNRDPRLASTFVPELRISGIDPDYSTSGYAQHKFYNEDIAELTIGSSSLNPTDAPVIRYGEVLLNYVEASAELGTLTQADLDKTINVLRQRGDFDMPPLQVSGENAAAGGVTINDPKRDSDVSPILWEIRRERRVELMMEGFRLDDLKRWKKLEYVDTIENPDINRGAWVDTTAYSGSDIVLDRAGTEGYIVPAYEVQSQRRFPGDYVYLNPIPLDQIQLYKDNGITLEQNPGW